MPPCSLNYDDVVCDGLYDLWGSFPELQAPDQAGGPHGPAHHFPSLHALRNIAFWEGDAREVGTTHRQQQCHQLPVSCIAISRKGGKHVVWL